ncbi:MAG TPA: SHOCT domain-containing protein [Gaiellaceae bacterium]|nr:SHOCT domain-containing protein [Gaiellaceae bacterium]
MVGAVIGALFTAFIIGALARFALPGPDPMPPWLTILIGLGGSAIGYGIVYGAAGKHAASWAPIASFFAAVSLVVIYRRFVQKRALWGADAFRFPERGFGVDAYRERLRRAGIDPDQIGIHGYGERRLPAPVQPPLGTVHDGDAGDPTENPAHYLGLLEELHDRGVLDDDEYTTARVRLLESLRP